jgi:hypothetical protein
MAVPVSDAERKIPQNATLSIEKRFLIRTYRRGRVAKLHMVVLPPADATDIMGPRWLREDEEAASGAGEELRFGLRHERGSTPPNGPGIELPAAREGTTP